MPNELRIQEICNRCNGTGIDDRTHDGEGNPIPETCGFCSGDGWVETDKIDITAVITKFDALDTKLDTIETHLDTIQAIIEAL